MSISKTRMARKSSSGFVEFVKTGAIAVAVALVIRTLAYEPFNIPSGSMVPTLLVGDYLFVSKYSYGYSRHSFPYSLGPFSGRILAGEPQRGDVAVFKLPRDGRTDYIKRIIGLPGDRIQVRGGLLHINGQPMRRERIEDYIEIESGAVTRVRQFLETLPGSRAHRIIEYSDTGPADNTDIFAVPPGHFFAMGDNRDNSLDSRADVGFVPAENLVGRAEIIFFSTDGSARWFEFWKWPTSIRFERIFGRVR
ncbi:MAG TPA: signal peptidase I [Alphaproteobacteria bacterium]|nr:signal peptidase I [Alphaproteobacteria bacterium]